MQMDRSSRTLFLAVVDWRPGKATQEVQKIAQGAGSSTQVRAFMASEGVKKDGRIHTI